MSFLTAKKTKKEETKKKEKKSMSSKVQVPALKQFDLEVPCYKVDLSSQIDFQWRTSSRVGLDWLKWLCQIFESSDKCQCDRKKDH